MTLGTTFAFPHPFYSGVGASVEVPGKWDVAINGRGYMLDTEHPAFTGAGIETIPLIRQQADGSSEPGESTINPEDLWPRSQSSWHMGAGQRYLDAKESDRHRFRTSLGIDPWTLGQLGLLNSTSRVQTSANTNLFVLRVGTYLYFSDGTTVKFAAAPFTSYTSSDIQNGESAQNVQSITSNGYSIWAALGSNGIHVTTRAATSSTHYSDLQATLVGYVKGRLMAAKDNVIYNVTASGAAPSALLTQPNTDFAWVGFAEGTANIYAAGFSGDKSLIYRTTVKADGTALDVPVVAGELPDGEIVRSIVGYLGFLVIGSDLGFRLAEQDSQGNLRIGALVETGTPCRAFEPQSRFVWFGWDNYDATHTGLGRMDLSSLTAPDVPAYVSDLMALNFQGSVLSVATAPGDLRAFTVSGQGLFIEGSSSVTSGSFTSGLISYGIPDKKIALRTVLKHKPLPASGSVTVSLSADDGPTVLVGSSDVEGSTTTTESIKVQEVAAQLFELTITLAGTGTILESYDFKSYPSARRGQTILAPILLHELVETATGKEEHVDVSYERQLLEGYAGLDRLVSYQELGVTYSVFVEGTAFQRYKPTEKRATHNGTLLMRMKVLGD